MHNKTEVALKGPLVQSVSWDEWNPSWGHFHHGIAAGVCTGGGQGWVCGGLKVCIIPQLTFLFASLLLDLTLISFRMSGQVRPSYHDP